MPTNRIKRTSEVTIVEENVSTSTSEVDKMTLDEYLGKVEVHPGLVASFRVEIKADEALGLPKTEEDWKLALVAQSNRTYE